MQVLRNVAPFAGAWIEMSNWCRSVQTCRVAPFAGAWIEMIGLVWLTV